MVVARDYVAQLRKLLPTGPAWPDDSDSTLSALIAAFAAEFLNVDERGCDLLREADPWQALELLPDWETTVGLPDPCVGELKSLYDRRRAVVERLSHLGGQSRQYFIDLAAGLGYTITISEFTPFVAGDPAGKALTNGGWKYAWQVNAPETTITRFSAGRSGAGDPLAEWGNDSLECALERAKPAHTQILFVYS